MADEVPDDTVQQHDSDQAPAQASDALPQESHAESAAPDASDDHAIADEGAVEDTEPSALAPGGKRFKQVYARAKDAEAKLQQLREEKARLEGELAATRTAPPVPEPKPEPRYTWEQLEKAIDDGTITRAKAMEYDRETLRQEMRREYDDKLKTVLSSQNREQTVQSELAQYKHTIPAIKTVGTPERQKIEREFSYLVSLGHDPKDLRTELIACRAALGDLQTIKEKQLASQIPNGRTTMQDIASNGKPKPDAKDPVKALTGEERQYYQRMIDRGQYKDWKAVREELDYVPPGRR